MADIKICNLDLIAPVKKRELVIGGKTFAVEPLTVAKFIEMNQLRQSINDKSSLEEGLNLMKKMVRASVPEMTEEFMDTLPLGHLQLIVSFINDEIPDEVLNAKAQENKKKEEEKEEEEGSEAEDKSGN